MPYIDEKQRAALDMAIDNLAIRIKALQVYRNTDDDRLVWPDYAGPLNYSCTKLALILFPKRRYWALALVIGVFVTVVLEYYRRWAAPYEDQKIKENGDVYPEHD